MENILFESEVFNKEAKGMSPFRIRVTESITNGTHTVQVIHEVFVKVNDNLVVKNEILLNGSAWREWGSETGLLCN